jgi:hypothetical protein
MNIKQLMKQAQQMQEQMQRKLAETTVEGTAGGGMVTATMRGTKELIAIRIDKEASDPAGRRKPAGGARRDDARRDEDSGVLIWYLVAGTWYLVPGTW